MHKLVVLALAGAMPSAAFAGPTAVGAPLGFTVGVTVGQVVGGVVGAALPVAGGSVLLVAAVGLAAGIRMVRRKQDRQRKEPVE
jgi:membrane protein implicated in regulation of membrane protease activity